MSARRVAERRDQSRRIDDRRARPREHGRGRAERQHRDTGPRRARADRGAHVVAAAGRNGDAGRKAELARRGVGDAADRLVRRDEARQRRREPRVDRVARARVEGARRGIEEPGARRVARLHRELAGEPQVHPVVRQQDVREPREVLGLVALQPQDLRRGETGRDRAAERRGQLTCFGGGARVAPELGWAENAPIAVERDEAVLLTGDADARDAREVDVARERARARAHGVPPGVGVLLGGAGREVREEVVGARRARDDGARIDVDDEGLRALRADVEAEEERAHRGRARLYGVPMPVLCASRARRAGAPSSAGRASRSAGPGARSRRDRARPRAAPSRSSSSTCG